MRTVAPRWRNEALAWFLSRLQLAQAEGQGIQTIRSTMKAAGCPPPVFESTEVSVTCVLRAHPRFVAEKRGTRGTGARVIKRPARMKPAAKPKPRSKSQLAEKTKVPANGGRKRSRRA